MVCSNVPRLQFVLSRIAARLLHCQRDGPTRGDKSQPRAKLTALGENRPEKAPSLFTRHPAALEFHFTEATSSHSDQPCPSSSRQLNMRLRRLNTSVSRMDVFIPWMGGILPQGTSSHHYAHFTHLTISSVGETSVKLRRHTHNREKRASVLNSFFSRESSVLAW